jgi:biotin operon repressor
MIDIMRTVHGAYAPDTERFGARLETFFIGLCVAMADIEGKPLSVAKITGYMGVPRTTVIRRLNQLQKWGLIDRRGRRYYTREKTLNSLIGLRSYQQVRHILSKALRRLRHPIFGVRGWPRPKCHSLYLEYKDQYKAMKEAKAAFENALIAQAGIKVEVKAKASAGKSAKRQSLRAREAEWELGTFATDKYRSSITASRKSLRCMRSHGCVRVSHPLRPCDRVRCSMLSGSLR